MLDGLRRPPRSPLQPRIEGSASATLRRYQQISRSAGLHSWHRRAVATQVLRGGPDDCSISTRSLSLLALVAAVHGNVCILPRRTNRLRQSFDCSLTYRSVIISPPLRQVSSEQAVCVRWLPGRGSIGQNVVSAAG